MPAQCAIGIRVKSGRAIAVVLGGSRATPVPVLRTELTLCDPKLAATRQPYHDGFGTAQEDQRVIARLSKIVERCTAESISALLSDIYRTPASSRPRISACLVVGSVIDPATVGNLHIRAHAHEGRLFRGVVEKALIDNDVPCQVVVEKTLAEAAARALGRPIPALKRIVAALGDQLEGPWRVDEKAAATAAWTLLE